MLIKFEALAMKKAEALSKFSSDPKRQVALAAQMLGITKEAIYQWDENEIPQYRATQIELMALRGELPADKEK